MIHFCMDLRDTSGVRIGFLLRCVPWIIIYITILILQQPASTCHYWSELFIVITRCHIFYPCCFHYFLLHSFIIHFIPFHFLLPLSIIILLLERHVLQSLLTYHLALFICMQVESLGSHDPLIFDIVHLEAWYYLLGIWALFPIASFTFYPWLSLQSKS